jgi:hypothetical protein
MLAKNLAVLKKRIELKKEIGIGKASFLSSSLNENLFIYL